MIIGIAHIAHFSFKRAVPKFIQMPRSWYHELRLLFLKAETQDATDIASNFDVWNKNLHIKLSNDTGMKHDLAVLTIDLYKTAVDSGYFQVGKDKIWTFSRCFHAERSNNSKRLVKSFTSFTLKHVNLRKYVT